ncbi:carbohydrate kinase family protein [Erwinia sp. S38]|uniref:carbohydrate kinase family protein n=1 Tax=Erwinia sp. S38 TaxID=2769338 RepID=UPI00190BDE8D|nr:sugar kinase [Erwinia sp. S38]MBK0000975.1 sugar kinase [Erwinia sp. S38]
MSQFDAVFVGLTTLDIAGRPIRGIPSGGGVEFIEQIRLSPAGTACGAVMNAAKLGIHTAVAACLGDDEKGDFIAGVWRRLGIDGLLIQRTQVSETSATILAIRPNGERPALHCRGASDHLFIDEADFPRVCNARFLHLGGSGLLAAMDNGQSAKLLAWAHQHGVTTSFDLIAPNEQTLDLLTPMLPHIDYFMPSMEEAAQISGQQEPQAMADFFLDRGVGTCIFKDGARGSWVFGRGGQLRIPAWQVRVVDTTGCGDSYCGGFIAGLAKGLDVEQACRVGSAVASLVASGLGSDAGVVDWETTQAFMATTPTLPLSG